MLTRVKRLKPDKFVTAYHLRTTGCHQIRCHTVLLATPHKWAHHALTPASKAGVRLVVDLPTPEGWKAELTKVPWLRGFTPKPGIKLTTAWSKVQCPNRCAATPINCQQKTICFQCTTFSRAHLVYTDNALGCFQFTATNSMCSQAAVDGRKTFSSCGIPHADFTSKARAGNVLTIEDNALHVLTAKHTVNCN